MGNELDILYYDFMIESTIENRKIMEFVIGSSMELMLYESSSDNLVIYEGKIIETIKNSIKEIFQKVIDFISNIFKAITNNKTFITDENLIKNCNEKLKNMTSKEKNDFAIKEISIRGTAIDNQNFASNELNNIFDLLDRIVEECEEFSSGKSQSSPSFYKKDIEDCLQEIKQRTDKIKTADKKDVDIKTIEFCLDPNRVTYANSKDIMKTIKEHGDQIQKEMKDHQRSVDNKVKNSKHSEIDTKVMNLYRNAIYSITSCCISIFKFLVNMTILQFKNEEAILRKFMSNS